MGREGGEDKVGKLEWGGRLRHSTWQLPNADAHYEQLANDSSS